MGEGRDAAHSWRGEEEEGSDQAAINELHLGLIGKAQQNMHMIQFYSIPVQEPGLYKPNACMVTVLGTAIAFLTPSLFFSEARLDAILLCETLEWRRWGVIHSARARAEQVRRHVLQKVITR